MGALFALGFICGAVFMYLFQYVFCSSEDMHARAKKSQCLELIYPSTHCAKVPCAHVWLYIDVSIE